MTIYNSSFFIAFLLLRTLLPAQDGMLEYQDKTYVGNIRSVQFHITGLLTSNPIIRLGSQEALFLSFDDLDADSKYYYYTVIHCDRTWRPSNLDFIEYVDGFEGEEIDRFDRSVNTLVPFTHYSLALPNPDFQITKSGNYLLVVYLDDPAHPVITRRFMVVDQQAAIHAQVVQPANVSKLRTHHEIDFTVNVEKLRVRDPKNDIYGVVMQNGRWDNAITDIRSRFERGQELVFDYQDKIVFPAGSDFRNMDIRSTQYRSRDVFEITRKDNIKHIVATIDQPRANLTFIDDVDINGKFVVRNTDNQRYTVITTIDETELGELIEVENTVELTQHQLEADYLSVLFTLKPPARYDSDVYIFGALSNWALLPEFRMEWDVRYEAYMAEVLLKQGFYDYIYVLANKDGTPDETTIEGNSYEASNDYTVLIYHTPFGSRYDQLVGAVSVPSLR